MESIVVVGGGIAAGNAAVTLRENGYEGSLLILGDEPGVPFGRPPLSKGYLRGEEELSDWFVRPETWYAENRVELRDDDPAARVDTRERTVRTRSGQELPYDRLLIATGGRNRRLRIPGSDLEGVYSLRTKADSDAIRAAAGKGEPVVLVGIGFIGSELAASLTQLGAKVTALFPETAPLARVLGEEVAAVMGAIHRDHGVQLLSGEEVAGLEGKGRVEAVTTKSGKRLECTACVIGVGIQPNVEFLEGSGVTLTNGVAVDEHCRTNVPEVFACGDVADHQHPIFGRIRVEHFNNAERHGRAAGMAMLDKGAPYSYLHSFWSDQYDAHLDYIGLAQKWDRFVVRGSLEERKFVGFYLENGLLRAAVGLNRGGDPEGDPESELGRAGALIRRQARPDPMRLADQTQDLAAL
jgi:3-phenylpropionate/trans-cinnamate dioxygenase ferredoxin reductase subunit